MRDGALARPFALSPDRQQWHARPVALHNVLELVGLFFLPYLQEDSATVTAALLALNGFFPAWQTFGVCALGMWTSDFLVYLLGRLGGLNLFRLRWIRLIVSPSQVNRASAWFDRFGWPALVFSRLVPGSRTALLFASGLLHYPARKFIFVSLAAAISWLLFAFAVFHRFGVGAMAILGFRWIFSLILFLSGGAAGIMFLVKKWTNRKTSGIAPGVSKH
jgi:membrane protein DedA with SNARE-associated domain